MSGNYGSGPFKADAKANFFSSSASNNYSSLFIYGGRASLSNEIFQLNQTTPVSPLGQSALNIGLSQFRETCGNRFVQQFTTGAGLYFIVKFEFASLEQKSAFDATVGATIGAASLSASVSQAVNSLRLTGSASVRAIQIGGDAAQLFGIVGSNGANQAPIAVCALDNLTACSSLITNLLNYAATIPSQLKQVGAQNDIFGYVLQDYGVALIPQPLPSVLTLEVKQRTKRFARDVGITNRRS